MGRLFVLLTYGGLFSDLDVFPNRTSYEQCWMAVLRVERPKQHWKETEADVARSQDVQKDAHCKGAARTRTSGTTLSSGDLLSSGDKPSTVAYYEMEVLIASPGCTLMKAWLEHVRDQIGKLRWDKGFWKMAKVHYVLHH